MTACHCQETSQSPSSLWAFPSPGPAGIISFFQSSPWRQLLPISTATSPLFLLHARLLPPKAKKRGKTKPGLISPAALQGYFFAVTRAGQHSGGCLHKKPQRRPSIIAQPCQAQSILPLNMKLPLSPNPLPRGWISPHFSSLTLTRCGGLQGFAFTSLFLPCVLFSPLSFPSFSSGYFSRAGMLVLLLLPLSCDLNIKHRRKISPRAPSPSSIPGPRHPPRLGGHGWRDEGAATDGCHMSQQGPPCTPAPLLPPKPHRSFLGPFPPNSPAVSASLLV